MTQQCLSKHLSSPLSDSPTPTLPEIHLCPPFYPFEQDRWIVIDRERGLTPSSCWHAAVAIILSTFSLISRAHQQEVGGGTEGGRVAGRVHASGWEKDEHGNSRVTPP